MAANNIPQDPRGNDMKKIALGLLLFLTGCAGMPEEQRRFEEQVFSNSIPTCQSDKECEVKWAAARRWVLDNSGFKIQTYTDDYMETFNVQDYAATQVWARVSKEPLGESGYRILVELGCNNPFGCNLSPLIEAKISFNYYVDASWTKPQQQPASAPTSQQSTGSPHR